MCSVVFKLESEIFLSIIIRTQGKRSATLRDVLLCLSAQTSHDFEIIIVAHKVSIDDQVKIETIVGEQLDRIKIKTKLIMIDDVSGRSAPLNRALKYVQGNYISILDDDDLVFAHWVENFKLLSNDTYDKVLRAVTVEQDIEVVNTDDSSEVMQFKTISAIRKIYPSKFNLLDSLIVNSTPFMSWSFPHNLFRDLNFKFDESLHVCEDWDLAMRAILLRGYIDGPNITSIYRKWKNGPCSQNQHSQEVWRADYHKIITKFSSSNALISSDVMKQIINMRIEYQDLINSNSWFITKPLRFIGKIARRVKYKILG